MQRAGIENIIGLQRRGAELLIDPCVPKAWLGFEVSLRFGTVRYKLTFENPQGVERGISYSNLDGEIIESRPLRITLSDDGRAHSLVVRLG